MVELNATNAKSEDDIGGGWPEPGRYHVGVLDADESLSESTSIIVEFQILAGNPDGQKGRTIKEYFALTAKAVPRLHRFLLSIGIKPAGEIDMGITVGRQLVIEIEAGKYTDSAGNEKDSVSVSYMGFWSVTNQAVADVPKDKAMLAQLPAMVQASPAPAPQPPQGGPQQAAPPVAAPTPAPAQQARQADPAPAAPAAPPANPYANL